MCTLTYIPTKDGYLLTHNRDEREDRPTSEKLKNREINGQRVYYPEDEEAFGTWIAASSQGTSVCLMNGGSKAYERKDKYRHSRGLVSLDLFRYQSVPHFFRKYNFHDLEPFTLLAINRMGFWKITHNEDKTLIDDLDPAKTQILSSTTLYTAEIRSRRKKWFEEWLAMKPPLTPAGIRQFHKTAGEGDTENDLVMKRGDFLKTLSITQIIANEAGVNLVYEDLMRNSEDRLNFLVY